MFLYVRMMKAYTIILLQKPEVCKLGAYCRGKHGRCFNSFVR